MIKEQSGTDWKEMYQVFNMGHRMELYVPEEIADELIEASKSFNVDARIIGRCEGSEEKRLTIKTTQGTFEY
jgi:phosphoribosylformylglycinamidine cyclo-ligase